MSLVLQAATMLDTVRLPVITGGRSVANKSEREREREIKVRI